MCLNLVFFTKVQVIIVKTVVVGILLCVLQKELLQK